MEAQLDADLYFLRYHSRVQMFVQGLDGSAPASYNSDWDSYIVRVEKAQPGRSPDRYCSQNYQISPKCMLYCNHYPF